MKSVKMKGKDIDEAKKMALEVLGLSEEQVHVRVISKGKSGMLGLIGGEDAEVEVVEKVEGVDKAKFLLQEILNKMGFMALVDSSVIDNDNVCLEIKGEDIGRIIGRNGVTLDALQLLINIMINKGSEQRTRYVVDAEGYRDRNRIKLEKIANEAAEEVVRTGIEKTLPPMSAADRRIIHVTLSESNKVSTFSVGERADRSVVVAPKEG